MFDVGMSKTVPKRLTYFVWAYTMCSLCCYFLYSPMVCMMRLHMYPGAHPRARKLQVDFDMMVVGVSISNYDYDVLL